MMDQAQIAGVMWSSPKFLACKVDKGELSQRIPREKKLTACCEVREYFGR